MFPFQSSSTARMKVVIDITQVVSLFSTVIFAGFAFLLGQYLGSKLPKGERWILVWYIFDSLVHFVLEGAFVIISLFGTVNDSEHILSLLWKEYGKADKRWLFSDPTVVSLEILTVVLDGLLCCILIWCILTKQYYRHFFQIVLCVCELYGGWMTFCPEWLTGSKNLDTSSSMYFWVYLTFFNGLWVVIPLVLLYQSFEEMKAAFCSKRESESPSPPLHKEKGGNKRERGDDRDRSNTRRRR
ncbi:unnamed protein product [Lymnaea stagnalis]|uniref:EXPERA domain-containing protein n=1 Tax=Lymnaea stagnalis TaxID=6523 RepID=A0AAV2I729_LYMST